MLGEIDERELSPSDGYTLEWGENTAVGLDSVTVQGDGVHYLGSNTINFAIMHASLSDCTLTKPGTQIYTG